MKIKYKENKRVAFESLKCGDVFLWFNKLCIKIETTYENDHGDYENTVILEDGSLSFCKGAEIVEEVNCELVVL